MRLSVQAGPSAGLLQDLGAPYCLAGPLVLLNDLLKRVTFLFRHANNILLHGKPPCFPQLARKPPYDQSQLLAVTMHSCAFEAFGFHTSCDGLVLPQQADGEAADRGEVRGSVVVLLPADVFAEGHILNPMLAFSIDQC